MSQAVAVKKVAVISPAPSATDRVRSGHMGRHMDHYRRELSGQNKRRPTGRRGAS